MKSIVLASSSPRRKKLLEEAGYSFSIDPSNFDESKVSKADPREMVKTLSLEKAREVAKRHKAAIIIGADTTVILDGQLFEKPEDEKDAKRMLTLLSGKIHTVITGISVINTESNQEIIAIEESKVFFKKLTEQQIDEYIQAGEVMDKAGAYAIQEGLSQYFVEKTEGDYTNIVGLPMKRLGKILTKFRMK